MLERITPPRTAALAGALAILLGLACSHRDAGHNPRPEPAAGPEKPTRAGIPVADDGDPPSDAAAPEDEDCEQAREGQPCRAPYQHCALSCDDACAPCSLLVCEDGVWSAMEEFPEPGCDE